jgi:hypothetical protein
MTWDQSSGKSPLGLPLPETVGRQHLPTLDEMAREVGTSRGATDIEHLCPDCGGDLAAGRILIEVCRLCGGSGRISDTRMAALFGPAGSRVQPL